ncbi:hypothetical protein Tco_1048690 [Tanacetum coccineum]
MSSPNDISFAILLIFAALILHKSNVSKWSKYDRQNLTELNDKHVRVSLATARTLALSWDVLLGRRDSLVLSGAPASGKGYTTTQTSGVYVVPVILRFGFPHIITTASYDGEDEYIPVTVVISGMRDSEKHSLAQETVLAIHGRLLTVTGNNGWIKREQQATDFLEHNVKNDLEFSYDETVQVRDSVGNLVGRMWRSLLQILALLKWKEDDFGLQHIKNYNDLRKSIYLGSKARGISQKFMCLSVDPNLHGQ